VSLSGSGGMGKSALAAHFATEYQQHFPHGVIGLRVEDKDMNTIAREFVLELYKYTHQDLDPEDERPAATLMEEAFGQLKMLLIFDNVDRAEALQPLIPTVGQSAVIITTRDRSLPVALQVPQDGILDVPVLPSEDSLELLKRILGEERVNVEIEAAYDIIQIVESLPLALQIAGASLKMQHQRSLSDYAASLGQEKKRLGRLNFGDNQQHLNLRASFELSLNLLDPDTKQFFACLSVCGRDGFSRRATMAAAGLIDEYDAQDFLTRLYRLSLINYAEAGENRYVLHSLIRLFAQEIAENVGVLESARANHAHFFIDLISQATLATRIDAERISEDVDDIILAVDWLSKQENQDYGFALDLLPIFQKFGYWQKALELVKKFCRIAEAREDWYGAVKFKLKQAKYSDLLGESEKANEVIRLVKESMLSKVEDSTLRLRCEAKWCVTVRGVLLSQDLIDEAITVMQRAVEIDEILGDSNRLELSLNLLSRLLQRNQQWSEAVEVLQRAIEIVEALENPQQLSISLTTLGGLLQQCQRFDEAIDALQRAVTVAETSDNPQQLNYSLNVLGGVLQQCQRWDEAIDALQRAVTVAETSDNPQQLNYSLNVLGGALQQCQRWDEAIDALQRAVTVAETSDNPQQLNYSLNVLGGVLQQRQRWDEAIDVLQQAVTVAESIDDLQAINISSTVLGNLLKQQHRWEEAIDMQQKAVNAAEELKDSQELSFSLNVLGKTLQQCQRWNEAIEVLQRAAAVADTSENFQSLKISLIALGNLLKDQQCWDAAVDVLTRNVNVAEKMEDLQELNFSLTALGEVFQQCQRWDEAIEVLKRAVTAAEALENPQKLNYSLNVLGGVLQQRQRWDEAIDVLQQAVTVAETSDNPQQLSYSLNALGGLLQQRQRWEEAIEILERAVTAAEILDNPQNLCISLTTLGGVLQQRQRWEEAIEVLDRAVEVADTNHAHSALAVALSQQGRVLQLCHLPQKAEVVLQRGLDIAEDLKDTRSLGIILNTLGGVYKDLRQWPEAERCFRRCFDLAYKEKNITGQAIALNGLGQVLEKQGGEKFDLALAAFRKSIELGEQDNNQSHLAKVHTALGQALSRRNRIDEAILHLKQAFDIDVANRNSRGLSLIMLYLSQLLTRQGRTDEAIQYTQRAMEAAPAHQKLQLLYRQLTGTAEAGGDFPAKQGIVKLIRRNAEGIRYGYITPADGSRDIYFLEGFIDSNIIDLLDSGTLVEVEVKQQNKGPCASIIQILPDIGEI
jgi:tetratricopeptide (TPR) repeat protein